MRGPRYAAGPPPGVGEMVPYGRLTVRDMAVLRSLAELGCLSTADLAQAHFAGHVRYAAYRLEQLMARRLVERQGWHWVLLPLGYLVVQAMEEVGP